MTDGEVTRLARGLGAVEAQVKSLRVDWEKERRHQCQKFDRIFATLKAMEDRHVENDTLAAKARAAEETSLALRAAQKERWLAIAAMLDHGLTRTVLAALAAGAGFGLIADIVR